MTLTITVNDDLTSSTKRVESDGREALLELSEFNDSQEKFADKAAVETYVNAVASDDPRWSWKPLIGIVNDDLTSKWYIVNDSGQFEKQFILSNWNPLELTTFSNKEIIFLFTYYKFYYRRIRYANH